MIPLWDLGSKISMDRQDGKMIVFKRPKKIQNNFFQRKLFEGAIKSFLDVISLNRKIVSSLTADLLIEALHDVVVGEDVAAVAVPVVCQGALRRRGWKKSLRIFNTYESKAPLPSLKTSKNLDASRRVCHVWQWVGSGLGHSVQFRWWSEISWDQHPNSIVKWVVGWNNTWGKARQGKAEWLKSDSIPFGYRGSISSSRNDCFSEQVRKENVKEVFIIQPNRYFLTLTCLSKTKFDFACWSSLTSNLFYSSRLGIPHIMLCKSILRRFALHCPTQPNLILPREKVSC